jgi:hypothetical protein
MNASAPALIGSVPALLTCARRQGSERPPTSPMGWCEVDADSVKALLRIALLLLLMLGVWVWTLCQMARLGVGLASPR